MQQRTGMSFQPAASPPPSPPTPGASPGAVSPLSLERIQHAARSIDPLFLHSPQLEFDTLSQALGCRLTVKVETLNPVRCFKGRGADFLLAARVGEGRREPLVCASAGNFGQAMAYACRKHGIGLTVFAAVGANPFKIERMQALGAQVLRQGEDFDAAKQAARIWAQAQGQAFIEDGAQAEISEGAGSIAVELLRHDAGFDALLLPLGNGALLSGMARWMKACSPATRIVGVCSSGAPSMAEAWRSGQRASYPAVHTIADGIAVRVPIAATVAGLHGLMDEVLLVDDDTIVRAIGLVHEHAGLVVEPAAAVGIAALLANRDAFAGLKVATVLTGAGVTRAQIREYLSAAGAGVPADAA